MRPAKLHIHGTICYAAALQRTAPKRQSANLQYEDFGWLGAYRYASRQTKMTLIDIYLSAATSFCFLTWAEENRITSHLAFDDY